MRSRLAAIELRHELAAIAALGGLCLVFLKLADRLVKFGISETVALVIAVLPMAVALGLCARLVISEYGARKITARRHGYDAFMLDEVVPAIREISADYRGADRAIEARMLNPVREAIRAQIGDDPAVVLWRFSDGVLVPSHSSGLDDCQRCGYALPVLHSHLMTTVVTDEALVIPDLAATLRRKRGGDALDLRALAEYGFRSLIAVSVHDRGLPAAVLTFIGRGTSAFSSAEVGLAKHLGDATDSVLAITQTRATVASETAAAS